VTGVVPRRNVNRTPAALMLLANRNVSRPLPSFWIWMVKYFRPEYVGVPRTGPIDATTNSAVALLRASLAKRACTQEAIEWDPRLLSVTTNPYEADCSGGVSISGSGISG
jgi:hypothetical protein